LRAVLPRVEPACRRQRLTLNPAVERQPTGVGRRGLGFLLRCADRFMDDLRGFMSFSRECRVLLKALGQLELDVGDLLILRAEPSQRGLKVALGAVGRSPDEETDVKLCNRRHQVEREVEARRCKPARQRAPIGIDEVETEQQCPADDRAGVPLIRGPHNRTGAPTSWYRPKSK